jgi:alcohol dehydrogenase (cytochrome c)
MRSRHLWITLGVLLLIIAGSIVALNSVPRFHWRMAVARLKIMGALPDIGWTDLIRMARHNDSFNVSALIQNPDPYFVITNPYNSPTDISAGKALFQSRCTVCHGTDASGGPGGPTLQGRRMVQGSSDWALFQTISHGISGTAMPASQLPAQDKWSLVAYVSSLSSGAASSKGSTPASEITALQPVTYEELRAANEQPADRWLTYSGSYDGHRFSPISQITPANVGGLRLLWARQYNAPSSIETTPLVVGGYVFVTVPPNRVEALDAHTGAFIWAFDKVLPDHIPLCCGVVNRGLAVLGDTLFFGTIDAHLVSLDIATGRQRWDVPIADYKTGYSITGAPLAVKNLVITGVAGGEFGARGFIDARDAQTGKEVWRFDAIPEPGHPGANTWEGDSWKTGGGPTWMTGSFDPETNVIYWPVGNPSPNFNGDGRAGDNLYTNSVLALDADHGALRWYFQFTPHDLFDWDACETVMLVDKDAGGKRQRLLTQANRNGFYYVLDRDTGRFVLAREFAKQTWARGIDNNGRPIVDPTARPTLKGTSVSPAVGGGTNWYSPSYSPRTNFVYIPFQDYAGVFYKQAAKYHPGEMFMNGDFQEFTNAPHEVAVRAVDALTGEKQWEYRNVAWNVGGLVSTAGGVLFGSEGTYFLALDATTGRELWRINTGGYSVAAPITYLLEGKQMVTIAAGSDILTFGL